MKAPIEYTAAIVRESRDLARDYNRNLIDQIADVVDDYAKHLGWTMSEEMEVYRAAKQQAL